MMNSLKFFYHTMNWKVYSGVAAALLCFFWWSMYDNYEQGINLYDMLIKPSELLTYSYTIIPAYLVIVASTISFKKNYHAFLLRFKSRLDYFKHILTQLLFATTTFLFIVIVTICSPSLLTLSFKNEWSVYATKYYALHEPFLTQHSPFLYVAITLLLLWIFLFILGLLFFAVLLLTKNTIIALIFVLLVDILNVGVSIAHIEALYPFVFINYLDMFQFIYAYDLSRTAIPLQIFIYWLILFTLFYTICRFVVKRVDFNEKSVSNE